MLGFSGMDFLFIHTIDGDSYAINRAQIERVSETACGYVNVKMIGRKEVDTYETMSNAARAKLAAA